MLTGTIKNTVTNYSFPLQGHDSQYQLIEVTGLAPAPATVNMATVAGMDGARYNSARVDTRNIVITLKLNDADAVRKTLEDNFYTGAPVLMTVTTGDRTAKIEGHIDSFECELFSNSERAQISIICPDPLFQDVNTRTITISPSGTQITDVNNIDTGVFIRIRYTGATMSRSPVIAITRAGQPVSILTVSHEFDTNDTIEICTVKGRRSVTLIRNGVRSNIFGALQQGSTFWGIYAGHNMIAYTIDGSDTPNNALQVTVEYTKQYAGM